MLHARKGVEKKGRDLKDLSMIDSKYGSRGSKDESNFKLLCQVDLNVSDVVNSELSQGRIRGSPVEKC